MAGRPLSPAPHDHPIRFPEVLGRHLLGQPQRVPADLVGTARVVLLCFTMSQQLQVDSWLGPLREMQGGRAGLTVCELPHHDPLPPAVSGVH